MMRTLSRHAKMVPSVLLGSLLLLAVRFNPSANATVSPDERRGSPEQSLAIVVNRANPVDNMSFSELRKIFLGRRSHWSNGRRIAVVMLDYGQPERETVLERIYQMDENGYRNYFLRGMFRGEVFISPKTLATSTVVRKFVFNAPGAIGYMRDSDVDDSVKVVKIDGHLPLDKDYALQIDAGRRDR
jgi:ABC-type phosphate transport system substrate-binding protein